MLFLHLQAAHNRLNILMQVYYRNYAESMKEAFLEL